MLTSTKIKFIRSLERKKNRLESNLFVVEGEKPVMELLNSSITVHEVYHTSNFTPPDNRPIYYLINECQLERISFLTTPNKVLALAEIPSETEWQEALAPINNQTIILGLDNLSDPGNMGTILRIANWFGIRLIFCSPESVDCFSPKVVQASMGAVFRTKVVYAPLDEVVLFLREKYKMLFITTELNGESIYEFNTHGPIFLLMGNESHGIRPTLSSLADFRLAIPPYPEENNSMESLNVAVATAIFCAEFRRRLL